MEDARQQRAAADFPVPVVPIPLWHAPRAERTERGEFDVLFALKQAPSRPFGPSVCEMVGNPTSTTRQSDARVPHNESGYRAVVSAEDRRGPLARTVRDAALTSSDRVNIIRKIPSSAFGLS